MGVPHLMQENPSGYRCYYNQEDAFQVAKRPSRRQMQPRRHLEKGRSASAHNLHTESPREEVTHSHDPPTYEEAMQSLGRSPTQQDLGPFSPVYLSSSLVPYKDDSPSTLEGEERMEDQEEGAITKEDAAAEPQESKAEYVPSSPQYVPASDEEAEMSSDEDLEAPTWPPEKLIKPLPMRT